MSTSSRRLRTMPPPPMPHLPEHELFADLEDPLAQVLWRALRDVREWTATPPAARGRMFGAAGADFHERIRLATAQAPELAEALATFATLRTAPRMLSLGSVARACREVAEWAHGRELARTPLLFAEAAAALDAENPIVQNLAARTARAASEVHRADVWYDRAYILAARCRSRREAIFALIGRGALYRDLGRTGTARSLFERAARMASSTRRHRLSAEVRHEMLTIAAIDGEYAEAEQHMWGALREYPIHHPALPWLVHDWAFLLVRMALYAEAGVLLKAVLPFIQRKSLQVVVWGTLGRAAAGTGRRALHAEARETVLALAGTHEEYAAGALAHLAVGAQFEGRWEEAAELARRAAEIARERHQAEVVRTAEAILEDARARRPPPPQAAPPARNRLSLIERRVLVRLQERARPSRRSVLREPAAGGGVRAAQAAGQPTGPGTCPAGP